MTQKDYILSAYGLDAASELKPLGNGLINSTYLVTTPEGKRYVLQHINTNVFPDVDALQDNIERVTAHLRHKLAERGVEGIDRRCLHFVPNITDSKTYVAINNEGTTEYWRLMDYIADSVTCETVTAESAEAAGRAFGDFQSMLADMKPLPVETIKDFHNMEFRLGQLDEAIANDPVGRLEGVRDLVDEIMSQRELACTVERLQRDGRLPVRVCHCDTKVSNMLFDREGDVLCVIDLDTVMPGSILSDYGDFLRTAGNTAPEDEPDLDRISINQPVVEAFTRSYLSTAGAFLTDTERSLLPHGQFRFAYMQAVRFLSDYLNGDTYFRINYPDHNLVRARAQWRLAQLAMNNK